MSFLFYNNWPYNYTVFPTMEDHIDAVNNTYFAGLHTEIENIENILGLSPEGTFDTVVQRLDAMLSFIDRGDPADADKTNFTTNGAWHEWDLSSIIPAGAKAVLLRVYINDDAADSWMLFKKKGNSYPYNIGTIRISVANIIVAQDIICACGSDRIIEYMGKNVTFTTTVVTIGGWYL